MRTSQIYGKFRGQTMINKKCPTLFLQKIVEDKR